MGASCADIPWFRARSLEVRLNKAGSNTSRFEWSYVNPSQTLTWTQHLTVATKFLPLEELPIFRSMFEMLKTFFFLKL